MSVRCNNDISNCTHKIKHVLPIAREDSAQSTCFAPVFSLPSPFLIVVQS